MNNQHRIPKLKIRWPNWGTIMDWALKLIAVGIALIAFLFLIVSRDLPDPNRLLNRNIPESTKIYARDGTTLLYEIHGEVKRTLIPFDQMNDNIKHAVISIEDKNFYSESGISIKSIFRSIFVDLFHGGAVQGASTITQQFVRNAILTQQKTFSRKIKEIILSLEMNQRFSKDDILKLYLNEIPFGRNAYGIEAAASAYYGIHAKDLDLAQSAYLAAMIQAPSYYNPLGPHREDLDNRKNTVLDLMYQQGYIAKDQRDKAEAETVVFTKSADPIIAPHFVFYIEDYLTQKYGEAAIANGGLKVTTTLDPKLQTIAEKAVNDFADHNAKVNKGNNEALVAIDPKTGQILAMVGSKDYFGDPTPPGCKPGVNCNFDPTVNVATSQRQPGSSGKPYVYATAFKPEFKQAPATLRVDVVTDFGTYGNKDYIPQNYDGQEHGPVSIRKALAGSLNIPAVKTLALVGVDNAVQTMHDFGITSPLKNCGLSLVLGGCEVTLLDHTSGYATIATEGVHHAETGILKVEDSNGNVLEQFQDHPTQVLDPQAAYELISIMTDNNARSFIFGANSPLYFSDRTVAAKTGTTQNYHDGWTLGFTPSLAAGVWVGNNDGSLLRNGADGVVVAGPIFHQFMEQALAGTPDEPFTVPDGIQTVTVDQASGKLPTTLSGPLVQEIFASYAVPTEYDDVHIQSASGGTCAFYHSERPDLPNWENPVLAWDYAHGCTGGTTPPVNNNGSGSSSTGTTTVPGNPPTINITYPSDGSSINPPFVLQTTITPDTGNQIVRADLLVDGTFTQAVTSYPFNFNVNGPLSQGNHILAVHAVDDKGNTADTSITINVR